MPSAVSIAGFDSVTPPWLRPAAIAAAACVHVLVLVGIPWPRQAGISIPTPLELQVIPQGLPAEAVIPLDLQPAAQVRPSNVTPSSTPTAETKPVVATPEVAATTPAEQAAVNPAERLADAERRSAEGSAARGRCSGSAGTQAVRNRTSRAGNDGTRAADGRNALPDRAGTPGAREPARAAGNRIEAIGGDTGGRRCRFGTAGWRAIAGSQRAESGRAGVGAATDGTKGFRGSAGAIDVGRRTARTRTARR